VQPATNATLVSEENSVERLHQVGHCERVLFPELRSPPPDCIHSAGFLEESQPTYHWDGQRYGSTELAMILYTVSGRGRLRCEDRDIFVEPGQAMLVHFPHDHRHWIEDGERWEFFYVTLSGQAAVLRIRDIIAKNGPVVTLDARSHALAHAANACAAALENRIESPVRASELARAIVTALYDETIGERVNPELSTRARRAFVFDVEQFCWQNLSRPIGVEDMARVARMSRYHFSRQFERARGISPGRYLASLRLDEARRLLTGGGRTVKEVAERCGYGDANYFCKVFRRNFGVSPGTLKYASA
jgi:AraC-like DNA-binding protein